jgi:hypothetical protein
MKTSIWYHTADRQPNKSGYYLAYRSYSMGDDTTDVGYYYWDAKIQSWQKDCWPNSQWANIYYWSDADPESWVDSDPPVTQRKKVLRKNPALEIAWKNVEAALRQYEIVRTLSDPEDEVADE